MGRAPMSRRITFTYDDAAFLLRAALGWYEGLEESTRNLPDDDELRVDALGDLARVRRLKARARIGQTQLEHILATAKGVSLTELRS